MSTFSWGVHELWSGVRVASGTAPTLEDAKREAGHYAIQYAEDGPVRLIVRENRNIVLNMSIDLAAGNIAADIKT